MELETSRVALARSIRDLVVCVRQCGDTQDWAFRADGPAALDWLGDNSPNRRDPQPLEDAYRTGGLFWNLVSDLALSVADLLETERRIGALVASRSLAEAAARMWYLLEDNLAPTERIRRVVNDRLSGLHEDWRMAKDEPLLDST